MGDSFQLPGYEIMERVGEGGMATVWKARQVSLDRTVAIKILSPSLVRDEGSRRRFQMEAKTAARLNHPGIIQVHDAGEEGDLVYIVMEFVGGTSVAQLLERRVVLSEKHALLIAEGVALALGYAWEQARLIHCDVKPGNILVDEDGTVKIGDMGLSRFVGSTTSNEDRGMIEGTPHYTSPEQVRGDLTLDFRSDIYSLGATLYHVVTGRLPFGDTRGVKAMERQVSDYLQDPLEVNHGVSPGCAWLIEKMMVKDRTLRHQSWQEVVTDIEEVRRDALPVSKAPALGQSTVLRSEMRMLAAGRKPDAPAMVAPPKIADVQAPTPAIAAEPALQKKTGPARQKIVLPKKVRNEITRSSRKVGIDLAREVGALVLLLFAAFLAYGSLTAYHLMRDRGGEEEDGYWEEETAPASRAATAKLPEAAPRIAPASAVAKPRDVPKTAAAPITWKHPTFLKGARLFNDALEKYKAYQQDKQNPDVLKTVEQQCREAIRAFEFVKPFAPEDVDVAHFIDQSYRLISDCRQSSLIAPSPAPSRNREPRSEITATPAAPEAREIQDAGDLILAPNWSAPHTGGKDRIVDDFAALLEGKGVPAVDLKADTSLVLFGQIFYMMPVQEAARIMKSPAGARKRLTNPAFPKDSFFYYTLKGNFGDGFEEIVLIADGRDRIVGVQLVNEHPDESLWLEPQFFQERWHGYDFVGMKAKGNSKWRIAHRAEQKGRVVQIDTELVSHDPNGYFGLGDSKARMQMFLPEPIVNLILQRLQQIRKS